MVFDPDDPHAHDADRQPATGTAPPNPRRDGTPAERTALAVVRQLPQVGDVALSIAAQATKYGDRLTERQWAVIVREARPHMPKPAAPYIPPPAERELYGEMREVESQLDGLLALPLGRGGERCLRVVEEIEHRGERIQGVLGIAERVTGISGSFGRCGTCPLSPATACARCARGEPHPGQACTDGRRNRTCKGIAFLAALQARLLALRGDIAAADDVREGMGLSGASAGSGGGVEVKP